MLDIEQQWTDSVNIYALPWVYSDFSSLEMENSCCKCEACVHFLKGQFPQKDIQGA